MISALDAIRKIPPTEMFKSETDKYSKFDEKVSQQLFLLVDLIAKDLTLKFVVFP